MEIRECNPQNIRSKCLRPNTCSFFFMSVKKICCHFVKELQAWITITLSLPALCDVTMCRSLWLLVYISFFSCHCSIVPICSRVFWMVSQYILWVFIFVVSGFFMCEIWVYLGSGMIVLSSSFRFYVYVCTNYGDR